MILYIPKDPPYISPEQRAKNSAEFVAEIIACLADPLDTGSVVC